MKRILQENPSGCGLACVAMLANKSYKEVREKARSLGFDSDRCLRTSAGELRSLLKECGISASKHLISFRNWDQLPDICILAINYNKSTEIWHWVVFASTNGSKYVFDPNPHIKTDKRTDLRRIKAKWYLKIELPRGGNVDTDELVNRGDEGYTSRSKECCYLV